MTENEADYGIGAAEVRQPKILIYDIECTGILGYGYGLYETNIHKVVEQPILLSFSYAWYDPTTGKAPKIKCRTLADMPTYDVFPKSDELLTRELWELFNETDVTIGHNSRNFDDKVANMFFLKHGLTPPQPHLQLDTKIMAKQIARFPGNSLNNLSQFFDFGQKTETTHADLWWDSINGGKDGRKAMKKMAVYNNQDVNLTIQLYEKLKPWYKTPVNLARLANLEFACPTCLSTEYTRDGFRYTGVSTFRRFVCSKCHRGFTERTAIKQNEGDVKPAFSNNG